MTPSTPSFTPSYTEPRPHKAPSKALGILGDLILVAIAVLLLYYVGLRFGLKGHALFEGGR